MAKKFEHTKQKHDSEQTIKITTPTVFGSHKSMVIKELDDMWVICKDDRGEYKTLRSSLDNGLADPYRNVSTRIV